MSDFAAEQLVPFLQSESLFSPLDDESRRRLAERMELRRFAIGETIFSEGDVGHDAWLVFSGRVRVLKRSDTGQPVTLATQGVGELFGEQAILNDAPRSATVRAAEDSVLFRIERSDFESVIAAAPRVRRHFEEFMQDRALRDFLRTATILETLKPRDVADLLDRLDRREYPPESTIVREGEDADTLFIIRSGQVRVVRDGGDQPQRLRTLGAGDCFGEWALIEDRTRTATVIAEEVTHCFALAREDFDRLFESAPRLRERLARRLAMYRSTDRDAGVEAAETAESAQRPVDSANRRARKKQLVLESLTSGQREHSSDQAPVTREPHDESTHLTPQRGSFNRWTWVAQEDQSDCGAASLAMVARAYGVRLPLNQLRDMANVGREGASLFSLAAAAEQVGFRPRGVETDKDHLASVRLPAIAHWQDFHFLVVFEIRGDVVTVGDPARGIRKLSVEEFAAGWTGHLLLLEPTAALTSHKTPPSRLSCLRRIVNTTAMTPFMLVSLLFQLVLIGGALQFLEATRSPIFPVMYFVLLSGAMGGLREWLYGRGAGRIYGSLASSITDALRRAPLRYFQTRTTVSPERWLNDVDAVTQLTGIVRRTQINAIGMLMAVALAIAVDPFVGLVGVAFLVPHIVLAVLGAATIRRRVCSRQSQQVHARAVMGELATPTPESLRSIGADAASAAQLATLLAQTAAKDSRIAWFVRGLQSLLATSSAGAFLIACTAHPQPTFGSVLAVALLWLIGLLPVLPLIGRLPALAEGLIALDRIDGLLNATTPTGPRTTFLPAGGRGDLEFDSVSFRYAPDEEEVLSGISFSVPARQTVAIVGRDGSGRSTLLRLLLGHDRATTGTIRIAGLDVADFDSSWLRHLGVVTRDCPLISGTVRDNIAVSDPKASLNAVQEAARLAGADGFIGRLPQGYHTMIGTLGASLSSSQQQRIGIARALLGQPSILILDEPTAELDDEQENRLWHDLHAVLAERTVILVPHRLKAAALADRIIVLDGGVIAEQGTHAELLEANGLYSFLWAQSQA